MKLMVPPTWDELMDDDVYAAYVRRRPRLPVNIDHGQPWLVVARRFPDTDRPLWGLKRYADYADAYRFVRGKLRDREFEDMAIVCRPKLWKPPVGFTWNQSKFGWCGRCRRPSMFTNTMKHHALRDAPALATEDGNRCHYCGAREIFASRQFRPRKAPVKE
jgi:hypothetical protein